MYIGTLNGICCIMMLAAMILVFEASSNEFSSNGQAFRDLTLLFK